MGLPAFDMSAFEAAQSAVTSKPRATTAVLLAPRLELSVSFDEVKEQVRASTDAIIARYASWRVGALRGVAEMPSLIERACRSQSPDLLRSMSENLADLLGEVEDNCKVYADLDDEGTRGSLPIAARARAFSDEVDTGSS